MLSSLWPARRGTEPGVSAAPNTATEALNMGSPLQLVRWGWWLHGGDGISGGPSVMRYLPGFSLAQKSNQLTSSEMTLNRTDRKPGGLGVGLIGSLEVRMFTKAVPQKSLRGHHCCSCPWRAGRLSLVLLLSPFSAWTLVTAT